MDDDSTVVMIIVPTETVFKYGRVSTYPGYEMEVVPTIEVALHYMRMKSYDVLFIDDSCMSDVSGMTKLTALIKIQCILINDLNTSPYFKNVMHSDCLYGTLTYDQIMKKTNKLLEASGGIMHVRGKVKRMFEVATQISENVDGLVKQNNMTVARLNRIENKLGFKDLPPEAADVIHEYEPVPEITITRFSAMIDAYKKSPITISGLIAAVLVILGVMIFGSDDVWGRMMSMISLFTTK